MTKPGYTHIAMLLDRSGSMGQVQDEIQQGIDYFIKDQQTAEGEATFELYLFNDDLAHAIKPSPLSTVERVLLRPGGLTALLDAMGRSIGTTGKYLAGLPEQDRPDKVVFVIVTDGAENSSRRWNRTAVKMLVTEQTELYKWQFVFLGANIDAFGEAASLGIRREGTSTYDYGSTHSAFAAASGGTKVYRSPGAGGQSLHIPDDVRNSPTPSCITHPQ